jgi:hypothetical protein
MTIFPGADETAGAGATNDETAMIPAAMAWNIESSPELGIPRAGLSGNRAYWAADPK